MTRASGNPSHWLRRRLGSAGRGRLRILEWVRESTPALRTADAAPVGFSPASLSAFSETHHLPAIASRLPWRGDTDRLRTIAWWGSALGDVAVGGRPTDRESVIGEGAAFNLAVALFDSVVERGGSQAAELAEALEPGRTRARLLDSSGDHSRLCCRDPALNLVATLFDAALSSAGRRLSSRPAELERLADQLTSMYRSEMGLSSDPFVAKAGPVNFIGALAGSNEAAQFRRLFQALAHFCQLWDDWQDLEEDFRRLAPNSFLGAPSRGASLQIVTYGVKGLTRVLGGHRFHRGIARALATGLGDTLAAARACDPGTYGRTLGLCRELVM